MSVEVTSTPAGSPSSIPTSAGPCDSPEVNQRSMVVILPRRHCRTAAGPTHGRRGTPDGNRGDRAPRGRPPGVAYGDVPARGTYGFLAGSGTGSEPVTGGVTASTPRKSWSKIGR